MIRSLWVINPNGERLDLNLASSGQYTGLVVFNLEGLGPPVASVNGVGGPGFDGIRVNSVRADSRTLSLSLAVQGFGSVEESAKALIYKFFPIKRSIIFGVETDAISLFTEAYVEQNEFNQFAKVENATISLICANPYFKELAEREYSITASSGIPQFQFPFSNESLTADLLEFGFVTTIPTAYVYYTGVPTGCYISMEFQGYVEVVSISNINGDQRMYVDLSGGETALGGPIQAGDRLLIDTHVGSKSAWLVRGGNRVNVINGIGLYDDWIQLLPGNNILVVQADVGTDLIETDVRFNGLVEGV